MYVPQARLAALLDLVRAAPSLTHVDLSGHGQAFNGADPRAALALCELVGSLPAVRLQPHCACACAPYALQAATYAPRLRPYVCVQVGGHGGLRTLRLQRCGFGLETMEAALREWERRSLTLAELALFDNDPRACLGRGQKLLAQQGLPAAGLKKLVALAGHACRLARRNRHLAVALADCD